MIKNNKQLNITKSRLKEFRNTVSDLEKNTSIDIVLKKVQLSALKSMIEDLESEIETYNSLRKDDYSAIQSGTFFEIARILIQTRICKRWSQTDLAKEIGIDPQQIQRYEATDYEGASLTRLYDIIDALDIPLRIFLQHSITKRNIVLDEYSEGNAFQDRISNRTMFLKVLPIAIAQ